MLNLKKVLVAVFAVGSLLCFCSAPASAQWTLTAKEQAQYTNHPCANPKISFVLGGTSSGGVDCDPSNYTGYQNFTTAFQWIDALAAYRNKMAGQQVTITPLFVAPNGHTMQTISISSVPKVDVDYGVVGTAGGSLVGNAGGTLVGNAGGTVVATGGGNLLSHDGSSFRISGGGIGLAPQRSLSDVNGTQVIQFPGRYVKVSPVVQAQQPARPAAPQPQQPWRPTAPSTAPATHSDQDVQICTNNTVNQVRRMDGGANHINLSVSAGTAYFTGNILNASYKNTLTGGATSCGARGVNTNNLRVGR